MKDFEYNEDGYAEGVMKTGSPEQEEMARKIFSFHTYRTGGFTMCVVKNNAIENSEPELIISSVVGYDEKGEMIFANLSYPLEAVPRLIEMVKNTLEDFISKEAN